jgi:cytochrome c biogenesis protein CcdA
MVLFVLVYLGGVLTIISPCILPVLPFVFARADRPFVRSGLPLLIGMAATFAAVATLAAVGGGWAVQANQYGRGVSIALLALSRSRASHWRTCFRLAEAVARGRRVDQEGRVPFLDPGVQAYAFTFG